MSPSPEKWHIIVSPVDKWVRCGWSLSVSGTASSSLFSSVLVCLHSDGRDGEWLVWWFQFQFSMVDKVTFSLFQHQSNLKYHGHCYPFQTKKIKHVLDISVSVASTHLAPILGRGLPPKQEAAHSFSPGIGISWWCHGELLHGASVLLQPEAEVI